MSQLRYFPADESASPTVIGATENVLEDIEAELASDELPLESDVLKGAAPSEVDDEEDEAEEPLGDDSPGGLLRSLEKRQDEVLAKLDELNAQIESVLLGLGVTLDDDHCQLSE
jgi:hypothetical protein